VIHEETKTFSLRSAAEKWGKRREVELEDPQALGLAMHGETTLTSFIRWDIVQQKPNHCRYIFPYDPKSVSSAFTEACKVLGIVDLRFHDLRQVVDIQPWGTRGNHDVYESPGIQLHAAAR
jgi:hypothetical protein